MDICDLAADRQMEMIEDALRDAARRLPRGESAEVCIGINCAAPIPEARRRAIPGVQWCVDCQRVNEMRAKR